MIKQFVISTLAALMLFPTLANAQSTYSECQRTCVGNGLSCVLRCAASGARNVYNGGYFHSAPAPTYVYPPPVHGYTSHPAYGVPQQQVDVGAASVWNLPGVSTVYTYSPKRSPSFPSTARNFPPSRGYNSEHTPRRHQYNR